MIGSAGKRNHPWITHFVNNQKARKNGLCCELNEEEILIVKLCDVLK